MIENVSMYLMSPRYYEGKREGNSITQISITIVHDNERLSFTKYALTNRITFGKPT
jgi:hypothetical protein